MSESGDLKISIITVVYNGETYLEEAIESVLPQKGKNCEYIIIDGSSKDRTLDIIKRYDEEIDQWISEPDDGLYDAMNKGIVLSTGDVIGIVNSDDRLKSDTIERVKQAFVDDPTIDYVYGDVERIKPDGTVYDTIKAMPQSMFKKKSSKGFPYPMAASS